MKIREDLVGTARSLGIPVDEKGAIDLEDPVNKMAGFQRMFDLFNN